MRVVRSPEEAVEVFDREIEAFAGTPSYDTLLSGPLRELDAEVMRGVLLNHGQGGESLLEAFKREVDPRVLASAMAALALRELSASRNPATAAAELFVLGISFERGRHEALRRASLRSDPDEDEEP